MKGKYISYIFDGILAGIMICIGAIVLMSVDNKNLGAFLFSLGLFSVVVFKYGLFTGKVGYILNRDKDFLYETIITLFSNLIGTLLAAKVFSLTRLYPHVMKSCIDTMTVKINDSLISSFVLAVFCGILMFTAVEAYRKCTDQGSHIGAVFSIVLPVFVFIVCGFNHCIADMAYYFLAGSPKLNGTFGYFVVAILGNVVGGIFIPSLKICLLDSIEV